MAPCPPVATTWRPHAPPASNGAANVSGLANLSLLQAELAGLGKTVTTSSSYSTALLAGQDAVLLFGYGQGANDATHLAAYVNGGANFHEAGQRPGS